jgi:hypothetical protein
VAACYGALALRVGPGFWSDNIGSPLNAGVMQFALTTAGLKDAGRSLAALGESLALFAGTLATFSFVAKRLRMDAARSGATTIFVLVAGALGAAIYSRVDVTIPFRFVSLAGVTVVGVLATWWARRPGDRLAALPHLALWLFACACLVRIPLRASPHHYGFYLLPVPIAALAVLVFAYLPRLDPDAAWLRVASTATGVALLSGASVGAYASSVGMYALHTEDLVTPRGHLRLLRGGFEASAVKYLSQFPPETRIAVIPQGAGLTFLSGLRSADGTFGYLPMDLAGSYEDSRLVQRWERTPPDLIFMYRQDMQEFGYRKFGDDFGSGAFEFIRRNYVPLTDPSRPAFVLRRSDWSVKPRP